MSSMKPTGTPLFSIWLVAALISVPAAASEGNRPSDVMARDLAALARKPSDVPLLLASGRTALHLGEADAAAGFFGRAAELAPQSASAHLGMASALVALNRPDSAFMEFERARQLGTPSAAMAADLGLAYDLTGNQSKAQALYRSALEGPNAAEARRRLALSLAIGGNPAAAATALQPLLAAADRPALLTRAFILALHGDVADSTAALNEIIPASGSAAEPFLRALPVLSAAEKAATLNLGMFPTRVFVAASDRTDYYALAGPMEYGGTPSKAAPSNADQRKKAALALFGVFPEP